jgi:hypothetical protein
MSQRIERQMQIVHDLKKVIVFNKSEGKWYWHDQGDESPAFDEYYGPHDTFLLCVADICEPYEQEGNPCNICADTETPQHISGECGNCHGIDKIVVYWDNGTEDRFHTLAEAKEVILNAHAEGLAVDSIEGQDSAGETLCTYEITWDIQIDQQSPEVTLTPERLEWLQKQQTGEE